MLKVAVIGAGFIGSVHAKNVALHPATQLVAVSDVNLEAARKVAATTGAKAVGDAAEIFNDKEIEAVFIIHFFDLLRWITGDEAQEVYAIGAALVDPKVAEVGDVDTSIVAIRMASGALCQIDSARRTGYGYDERIEVFGSKGMIESRRQRARGVSRYVGNNVIDDGLHAGWFERIEQSYYRILDAFADALSKGADPSPSLEDGLKAQLLADKASESLKSGQPVKIEG